MIDVRLLDHIDKTNDPGWFRVAEKQKLNENQLV